MIHNKQHFGGIGARDIFNQIHVASQMLKHMVGNSALCREYYDEICKKNDNISVHPAINEENFVKLFHESRKINYIACFIENYRIDSKSTYAKYLVYDMNKKLNQLNYGFIPMGY